QPAAGLLQGGERQLRRDRTPRRRRDARARPADRARAPSPRAHLRSEVGEGRRPHRARLLNGKEEKMETPNLDFVHLIRQGAISTYPLLACSIVMIAVVLERLWALRGAVSSAGALTATLVALLARGYLAGAAEAVRRHRHCPARRVFSDVLEA